MDVKRAVAARPDRHPAATAGRLGVANRLRAASPRSIWIAALLILLPALAMLPFVTHGGRSFLHAMLDSVLARSEAVSLFSDLTVVGAAAPAHGLIVTSLRSGSPAATAGIAVGDRLEAFDARRMGTVGEAIDYLRGDAAPTVAVQLVHNRRSRIIVLPRGEVGTYGT